MVQLRENRSDGRISNRSSPAWPYHAARWLSLPVAIAVGWLTYKWLPEDQRGLRYAYAICGGIFAWMIVGALLNVFFDALANAHRDAVDKKERYNFLSLLVSIAALIIAIAAHFRS